MLDIFEAAVKMDIGNPWGKPTVHLTEIHQWSLQNSTQMGQEWMKTSPIQPHPKFPPPLLNKLYSLFLLVQNIFHVCLWKIILTKNAEFRLQQQFNFQYPTRVLLFRCGSIIFHNFESNRKLICQKGLLVGKETLISHCKQFEHNQPLQQKRHITNPKQTANCSQKQPAV